MITDNIVRSNFLHIAAYSIQMEEALIAFGIHWILLYRQQLLELLRDQNGIFILPLAEPGCTLLPYT